MCAYQLTWWQFNSVSGIYYLYWNGNLNIRWTIDHRFVNPGPSESFSSTIMARVLHQGQWHMCQMCAIIAHLNLLNVMNRQTFFSLLLCPWHVYNVLLVRHCPSLPEQVGKLQCTVKTFYRTGTMYPSRMVWWNRPKTRDRDRVMVQVFCPINNCSIDYK